MTNSKPPISTAVIKQIAFIALLSLLGVLLFFYLKAYLSGVLGALVLYILLRPLHLYLIEKKKWKPIFSIFLLFLLSFVVMLLPIWLTVAMLSSKVVMVINSYEEILGLIQNKVSILSEHIGYNFLSNETLTKISTTAASFIPGLLSSTVGIIAQIAIMYFVLFFMLTSGRKFEKCAKSFSPFSDNATQKLLSELKKMTVSNAIGIPLLGFVQALAALLGYWLIGIDEPLLWAVITGLVSVIPVVGSTIVWIPLAIIIYLNGNHTKALILLLYGALVISNVDSVFRFVVQKKMANIHPLITFFGVLIGLEIFGFTGLIFGPLLIAYFITLISVYKEEYRN